MIVTFAILLQLQQVSTNIPTNEVEVVTSHMHNFNLSVDNRTLNFYNKFSPLAIKLMSCQVNVISHYVICAACL